MNSVNAKNMVRLSEARADTVLKATGIRRARFLISALVLIVAFIAFTPQASAAGLSNTTLKWTTQTAAGAGGWRSVVWSPSLNMFVAVSVSSTFPNATVRRIMTSGDAKSWTLTASSNIPSTPGVWTSVTWSPELNLFVAVACGRTSFSTCSSSSNLRVITSPDGTTWTERTTPDTDSAWQSVTWSPELDLFVAVAESGTSSIMTSPDGITWTARTAPEDNAWKSVVWSPELSLFVAVGGSGTNRVMTSPDGTTWTAHVASEANTWTSVTWSPEQALFVAVSSDGTNRVMTSPDGTTWTARAASEANAWNAVTWSPELGIFVAVAGSGTNRVMTSSDGITWTGQNASVDNTWNAVTWSPGINAFVAVSSTGGSGVSTPRVMTGAMATSTTNTATNIGTTSATLNGDYQDNFIGSGVNAFFRYRTAGSGDSYTETAPQAIASAGSFSADISGLTPGNAAYEYKAVLQWSGASSTQTLEGGLQTFATDSEEEEEEEEDNSRPSISGGSIHYGCRDQNAVNYEYFSYHKQELCMYAANITPQPATSTPHSCPAYTFTRNLRQGDKGEDVRTLQKTLNCLGFTLATSGSGAPGEETTLFRELTRSAVARFQEAYVSEILTPLNLTSGTGYFAKMTRKKMDSLLGGQ